MENQYKEPFMHGENKYQKLIEIKKEKFPIWWVNMNKEIIEKIKEKNC